MPPAEEETDAPPLPVAVEEPVPLLTALEVPVPVMVWRGDLLLEVVPVELLEEESGCRRRC